jgi:hypothetical protein
LPAAKACPATGFAAAAAYGFETMGACRSEQPEHPIHAVSKQDTQFGEIQLNSIWKTMVN